ARGCDVFTAIQRQRRNDRRDDNGHPTSRISTAVYRANNSPAGERLAVAALVLGVASLVAAVSFVLFPLALLGGLVAAILGGIAVSRGRARGATNSGQAIAGIVCGVIALAIAVVYAVRVGTFVADNTS